jgi:hypothetical protein
LTDDFLDTFQASFSDPQTWPTRVRITLTGRTGQKNLAGSSQGVFADDDIYIRKTFSTAVALRNNLSQIEAAQMQQLAAEREAQQQAPPPETSSY